MENLVVIGAGQSAIQCITSLKKGGYLGSITLIGEEEHLPYQRPPLSKGFLDNSIGAERLYFKKLEFFIENIAISMFIIFVGLTLYITYWASKRTKTAKSFYTAGGEITGFQNGLAISGDFMSAASFLGISGLVYLTGFDGLIYSIGFLVGWPIILLLIAEPLRNLGKYSFADVASFRLKQKPIRLLAACGSLFTVILYLIAQMVGAGKLIEILFGLPYYAAVLIVGGLMILYVTFGGMLASIPPNVT